jgi:hypothetical protein
VLSKRSHRVLSFPISNFASELSFSRACHCGRDHPFTVISQGTIDSHRYPHT